MATQKERLETLESNMAQILEAVTGGGESQPSQPDTVPQGPLPVVAAAEDKAPQPSLPDVTDFPPALLTQGSGEGTALGVGYAQARENGEPKKGSKPRLACYVVPVKDGAAQPSDGNQFGMLRATSIRPDVIRAVLAHPKDAERIAEFVENHYATD